MLNILNSKGITNCVVIVTRYFGGILLGTGGLVRAYTGAMQEALKEISEVIKDTGLEVRLQTTYQDLEKMKYYLKQNDIDITNTDFSENVDVFIDITEEKYENLSDQFEELMPFMDASRGYFYGKSDIRQYTDADYEQLVGVHYRVVSYDDSYAGTWCTRWNIEIIEVYGAERYQITEGDYDSLAQMYIKGKPTTHLYGRPIPEVGKEYFRYIHED